MGRFTVVLRTDYAIAVDAETREQAGELVWGKIIDEDADDYVPHVRSVQVIDVEVGEHLEPKAEVLTDSGQPVQGAFERARAAHYAELGLGWFETSGDTALRPAAQREMELMIDAVVMDTEELEQELDDLDLAERTALAELGELRDGYDEEGGEDQDYNDDSEGNGGNGAGDAGDDDGARRRQRFLVKLSFSIKGVEGVGSIEAVAWGRSRWEAIERVESQAHRDLTASWPGGFTLKFEDIELVGETDGVDDTDDGVDDTDDDDDSEAGDDDDNDDDTNRDNDGDDRDDAAGAAVTSGGAALQPYEVTIHYIVEDETGDLEEFTWAASEEAAGAEALAQVTRSFKEGYGHDFSLSVTAVKRWGAGS